MAWYFKKLRNNIFGEEMFIGDIFVASSTGTTSDLADDENVVKMAKFSVSVFVAIIAHENVYIPNIIQMMDSKTTIDFADYAYITSSGPCLGRI